MIVGWFTLAYLAMRLAGRKRYLPIVEKAALKGE